MSLSNVIPIHFLLIIAYSLMPQTSTGENAEKMVNNNIVNAYTEFGFDLYKKEINTHKDENIFISPVSVSLALAMTSGGSEGETEKAILKTLNLEGIKRETLGNANKNLISNLLKDDKDVELSIANSIWLKKGVNFYEKFKTDTENYFFADLFSLTTADPINEWVEKKTNGRIKDIIESVSPADIAYLVNAIYFKGSWAEEFDRKLTKPKSFYLKGGEEIKVDMMKRKDRFKYLKTEEFEA
ncbi:MAG TPA: serpin family protein, partial [Candidatus Krumholzibacteriaceae bacterium]|nr:serpin family protein [Candidatus Krumholzibacteriaceae bacterium]